MPYDDSGGYEKCAAGVMLSSEQDLNHLLDMILALESVTSQAAVTIQNVRYIKEIQELFRSFVRMMSAAVDERSPYNANHSHRIARCGSRFVDFLNQRAKNAGEPLPFSPKHKKELIMSVWLHDIGKVTTSLEVMNKPERLYEIQKADIRHRMEAIRLRAKEAIFQISTAGFLPDERLAWLEGIRQRTYLDGDGQARPWLTEEEYALLSIRRGTLSSEERAVMKSLVTVTNVNADLKL